MQDAVRRMERLEGRNRRLRGPASQSVAGVIAEGSRDYDRCRHLARLLPIGPDEVADNSTAARQAILARLSRALRAERTRGRAGHWTYDLNRHLALSQAYAAECRLAKAGGGPRRPSE